MQDDDGQAVMTEYLWPYVWPQDSKKASSCDELVIVSYIGYTSLWVRVSWTQRLLGKLIQDQSWPLVRL
jgi:hypothetical protein